MDSPKSCKPTTTSTIAAETVPAQESPVFSYISNLSPIQPVKPPPVTQGFPGLNSPPLVFTSPRLNPQSRQTFLKRAQLQGLLAAKIPGGDEGCKNSVSAVNASENLDVQQNTSRITCNEKDSYSHNSADDQTESPTGCPDQFLTDIVDMDSVDQNVPSDSTSKKSEIIDQPPDAVTVTREIEDVHKEDASTDVSALETDSNKGDAIPVNQCPKIESELPVDHALTNRNQNSMTEEEEAEQAGFLHPSSHSLSGSQQTEKENENSVEGLEATGAVSTEPALKKVRNDLEAFQLRGVRRRCLQFEDALQCNRPAQNPSDSGGPKSPSMETPPTPIEGKQADTIPLYPRNINSNIKIPKPSGIGLHLNSIVNGVQAGSGAVVHVKSAQRGNFSIRGKRSVPIINSHLSVASNSSSVFSLAENVSPSTDDSRPESYASMAVTSTTSLSTFTVKPSNDSVDLNPVEYESTPGNNKRKYNNTETIGGSGEFKLSPKKKRKKSSDSGDGNGCKRCNCKKSQCLKLYCDCFAAGIYCAEPCACQGCYNRPEYEETVVEARQQIESRNPLAFAPKVVQNNVEPPASIYGEDGTHFTPSSARHKRGCNCKKSMCLKKYCECYQANVGCSDGCRCEGCKNVYGRKGEYGMVKDVLSKDGTNERADGSFVERMVASGNDLYRTELCNPHNLTPLTPAVQFLNHRKDASAAWFHSGEYFQSPESNLSSVAPHMMSPGSPRNPVTNGMISETAPEILDLVDRELCYGNAETADELMRVSHQPGKAGNHSGIPNPQEWANNSKDQSFSGNEQYSSSSLNWPGSPNTPMAQFSGTKHLTVAELDGDLSNIMEDDTPDILKDNPNPLNAVKVSSPNKKRVSPPHSRHHDVSSSSSYGVRTGRKFILKAVPSFPPLTPCIDSKSATQQINDPQNHTHNK